MSARHAPIETAADLRPPVLMVGNFLSASHGVRCACEELAERLAAAGWQIWKTSAKPGRLARLLDMVSTTFRKRQMYSLAQVDVYSGPAFFWAEVICLVLQRLRKPFILTLHGGNLPAFAKRWPARVRRLLNTAAIVTTPSRYLQEAMRPFRPDLRLLPNALALDNYAFRLQTAPKPHLLWLRAFHEIYNPALAPPVVARLVRDFPEVTLTMIGPDKGDGSLQRTKEVAKTLGVLDRIRFVGAVAKATVPAVLSCGDIFLNTANIDNTPVTVLEAMASGLCVVSTEVGGMPYLLAPDIDSLLVPPDDPQAMATAVCRLLTDPALAKQVSQNARRKVEDFTWTRILPLWGEVFRDVAKGVTA